MANVITDTGARAADFILWEEEGQMSRDAIIVKSGAGVVLPGTVLGKLTADGKYVPSPATGADGSQTGVALNIYQVDATSADVRVAGITGQAAVNRNIIRYEATVNDDTKKAAKWTQLRTAGIIVR